MLNAGTVLADRYQIVRLIGEGGMGTVYEAEQIALHRKVAVKVLLPEYARHQDSVARFEREARAAGTIGHDGIVEVIDFGVHGELPFMVMEYLVGESLADRLDRQRVLPIALASRIMGQVIAALGAAHAVGIVHRDLKPENIHLVTRNGVSEVAKLLDFGISKFKGDDLTMSKSLTKTGALMGTPFYMAPEQALARRDVDHRADLYSAGVMLYEMTTGRLPFMAESQAELLMAIVYQKPPATPPRAVNPALPVEFEALIMQAMAPDRENRFQNAASFVEALKPFGSLVDEAVPAPRVVTGTSPSIPMPRPTAITWDGGPDGAVPSVALSRSAPRRSSAQYGVLAALGAAVLGGSVALVLRQSHPSTRGLSRPESRSVAAAPAPVPSPTVSIELQGVPADAVVRLDGETTTQQSLTLPRGSRHHLEVSAPGRISFETDLVADRDLAQGISLAPMPVPAAIAAPVHPSAPVATGSPPSGRHGHGFRPGGVPLEPGVRSPGGTGASEHGGGRHTVLTPTNEF